MLRGKRDVVLPSPLAQCAGVCDSYRARNRASAPIGGRLPTIPADSSSHRHDRRLGKIETARRDLLVAHLSDTRSAEPNRMMLSSFGISIG